MLKSLKKLIKYCIAYFRIPPGPYCYTIKKIKEDPEGKEPPVVLTNVCPYWDRIDDLGDQECGYCHYLGYGDYDINNDETREFICTTPGTGEKLIVKAPDMPFGVGLLWDRCKECGINDPDSYYE